MWTSEVNHAKTEGRRIDGVPIALPLNMAEKVNYAIGPLKTGRNPYNAMRFLAYLATMEAQAIYESYGFVRAKPEELTLKPIPSK